MLSRLYLRHRTLYLCAIAAMAVAGYLILSMMAGD
jgi:hypothetical protein